MHTSACVSKFEPIFCGVLKFYEILESRKITLHWICISLSFRRRLVSKKRICFPLRVNSVFRIVPKLQPGKYFQYNGSPVPRSLDLHYVSRGIGCGAYDPPSSRKFIYGHTGLSFPLYTYVTIWRNCRLRLGWSLRNDSMGWSQTTPLEKVNISRNCIRKIPMCPHVSGSSFDGYFIPK